MGFVNLLFVLGAATLAGPLLYHLLLRDRARRQILPTLRFLGQAAPQTYAMHRVKNLLLLLLRLLVLALIVLAFMRPYRKSDAERADPDTAQEAVVFAVDTSLSMRAQDRWASARSRVETLLESQPADTRLALVLFDRSPRLAVADTSDKLEIQAALRTAKPGAASTDLLAAMRAAADAASHLKAVRKRVYLLSDFQKSGLNDVRPNLTLPPGVELSPVPVDDANRFNATIQSVREMKSPPKGQRRVSVQTASFGEGNYPAEIVVRDGGRQLASRKIVIEGSRPVVVEIDLAVDTDQETHLTAALELKDAVADDNVFPFKIEARNPIEILVVAPSGEVRVGAKADEIPPDANPFLRAAVRACEPHVRSTWLDPGQFESARLADYAVIVAVGAEGFTASAIARLKQYVQAGGSVILFPEKGAPGDAPAAPSGASDSFAELVGARFEGWREIDPEAGYRLVSAGAENGPLSILGGPAESVLGHPRVSRYLKVADSLPEGVEAVLRLDDGGPFLLGRKLGQGIVFCFTAPLDPRATDFVIRASFCPFLFEMFRHATRRAEGAFEYRVGDIVPANEIPAESAIMAPGDRPLDAKTTLVLSELGFYRIVAGGKNRTLAVRTDPRESDLAVLAAHEIDGISRLGHSDSAFKDADLLSAASIAGSDRAPDASKRFWFYLLFAALCVMALESLLAARTVR